MIFFTGDIHGNVNGVAAFINKVHPTMEDVIVLLGDVGANYYNGRKDYLMKPNGAEARDGCSQNIRTWSLPRTVRSIR